MHRLPRPLLSCLLIIPGGAALAVPPAHVNLGVMDFVASDQPRVAIAVEDPADPGVVVGPDFYQDALLDTGANGLVMGKVGYFQYNPDTFQGEFNPDLYDRATRDDGTTIYYEELGVAGTALLDVLKPYNLYYADATGTNDVIEGARILGAFEGDFGSFPAIVGMPAMVGRVTTVDLTRMSASLEDFDVLRPVFSAARPASTTGISFHVPLTPLPIEFPGLQRPDDPTPTYAPVPLVDGIVMRKGTLSSSDSLLLDTGAQTTLISTATAERLGLNLDLDDPDNDIVDVNGDGRTTVEDLQQAGGLGGSTLMPLTLVESLSLPTQEGTMLTFTDVVVGVLDIPGLGGVLGMNMLTSGYSELLFAGTGEYGAFRSFMLDFTDPSLGVMRLDVNPEFYRIPGDADGDGDVDDADLALIDLSSGVGWGRGDFDFDGVVDADDLALYDLARALYGSGGYRAVPEPTAGAWAAGLALALRRRRR